MLETPIALGVALASLGAATSALPVPRTARARAVRNRVVTAAWVVAYLALAGALLPDADARASFHHLFVLTIGYGHLLGAFALGGRRAFAPEGVPLGLWRTFSSVGVLTAFAAYGVAIQYVPTLVLVLLAIATWHTAENDLSLADAYANKGRMKPLPRAAAAQVAPVGLALLVMGVSSASLPPDQFAGLVEGTAFEGAPAGLSLFGAALCGAALVTQRGRRGLGVVLIALPIAFATMRPPIPFGDIFAATTLYHLVSWLVLLGDRARMGPGPAAPFLARVALVHAPAGALCGFALVAPAAVGDAIRALIFSPGIYLFGSVLHVVQTAALRGRGGPRRAGARA